MIKKNRKNREMIPMKQDRRKQEPSRRNRMSQPAYPAYRTHESAGDKAGIVFRRVRTRWNEWLNRIKNWKKRHDGEPDKDKETNPENEEYVVDDSAVIRNVPPVLPDDGYVGRHARKATANDTETQPKANSDHEDN